MQINNNRAGFKDILLLLYYIVQAVLEESKYFQLFRKITAAVQLIVKRPFLQASCSNCTFSLWMGGGEKLRGLHGHSNKIWIDFSRLVCVKNANLDMEASYCTACWQLDMAHREIEENI